MTKTEHGGTGSVMNNLSSCPSRAASSARRGAPTIIRFLGWHGAHLFPWQHTFLPCVTDKTVSTAIQQEQGRQSGWWDSEMPSVWGEASFHSPSLKQLHNSLSQLTLFTHLFIFLEGFFLFLLVWHSLYQISPTSTPDPSSIRLQRRENYGVNQL